MPAERLQSNCSMGAEAMRITVVGALAIIAVAILTVIGIAYLMQPQPPPQALPETKK
jgi:hypothetical protein